MQQTLKSRQLLSNVTAKRRGFTLVEVLCCLAIVTLLATMLFPVIAQARERTQQAAVPSAARALTRAIALYAEDYESATQVATGCGGESHS